VSLPEALLQDPAIASALRDAGSERADLDAAVDPGRYLGASAEFVRRALAAHTAPGRVPSDQQLQKGPRSRE
jgi:hypothetical protein